MKQITQVKVWPFAKMVGVLYAIFGLIGGFLVSMLWLAFPEGMSTTIAKLGVIYDVMYGPYSVLVLPVFYIFLGTIFGAIFSWVYNWLAKGIGGIKIDLA